MWSTTSFKHLRLPLRPRLRRCMLFEPWSNARQHRRTHPAAHLRATLSCGARMPLQQRAPCAISRSSASCPRRARRQRASAGAAHGPSRLTRRDKGLLRGVTSAQHRCRRPRLSASPPHADAAPARAARHGTAGLQLLGRQVTTACELQWRQESNSVRCSGAGKQHARTAARPAARRCRSACRAAARLATRKACHMIVGVVCSQQLRADAVALKAEVGARPCQQHVPCGGLLRAQRCVCRRRRRICAAREPSHLRRRRSAAGAHRHIDNGSCGAFMPRGVSRPAPCPHYECSTVQYMRRTVLWYDRGRGRGSRSYCCATRRACPQPPAWRPRRLAHPASCTHPQQHSPLLAASSVAAAAAAAAARAARSRAGASTAEATVAPIAAA